jgi:hypothetical protein
MQETATTERDATLSDWTTVDKLVAENPQFGNRHTLDWYLRSRDTNGLGAAVVRVGKNLLISKVRFAQWLEGRAGQPISRRVMGGR